MTVVATARDRWVFALEDRRLCLRVGAVAFLYLVLEALDWTWLHRGVREAVAFCLEHLNHGVVLGLSDAGSSCLGVDGTQFRITRGCTYINVAMTLAPFLWRFQNGLDRNLLWLLCWFVVIFAINIARLVFAAHFRLSEWTWSAAHDWPNQILRWSIVVPAVLLALRADRIPPPTARHCEHTSRKK